MSNSRRPPQRLVPPSLRYRIQDAGASARRWHDTDVSAITDPHGKVARFSRAIGVSLAVVAALVLTAASVRYGWQPAVLAVLGVAVGLLIRRFRGLHAVGWAALGFAASWPMLDGPQDTVVVFVVFVVICLLRRDQRAMALAVTALVSAAIAVLVSTAPTPGTQGARWLWAAAVSVTAILFLLRVPGTGFGFRLAPVSAADLTAMMPPIKPAMPWLARPLLALRRDKSTARKAAGVYGELRTALLLLTMRRFGGTGIFHDVAIPNAANANADHVVLSRGGLFIIDSKQYGRRDDPGTVAWDQDTHTLVHRTRSGATKEVAGITTSLWAARAISETLNVAPRTVIFAIHTAHVEEDLIFEDGDTRVIVLPAAAVPTFIDAEPHRLTRRELFTALTLTIRLHSATTGTAPRGTAPLGAARDARAYLRDKAAQQYVPAETAPSGFPAWVTPGCDGAGRSTLEHPAAPVFRAPDPTDEPVGFTLPPVVPSALPAVSEPPRAPAATGSLFDFRAALEQRWADMENSEPASPDDIEQELRDLGPGSHIMIISVSDDGGINEQPAVAVSRPCHGVEPYIWYCGVEQWNLHQASGYPVSIDTVKLTRVVTLGGTP